MPSFLLRLILVFGVICILIHGLDGRRTHRLSSKKLRAKAREKREQITRIKRKMKNIMDRLDYAYMEVGDRYDDNYWDDSYYQIDNVYEHWNPMDPPDPSKSVSGGKKKNINKEKKILTKEEKEEALALALQKKMKKNVKAKGINLEPYHWVNIHGDRVDVLYHATNAKEAIEKSMAKIGSQSAMILSKGENKPLGEGIYFCDDPAAAAIKSQGGNAYIVEAKVLLGKPWDSPTWYDLVVHAMTDDTIRDLPWSEKVARRGYDSIIVRTIKETYDGEMAIEDINDVEMKKKIKLYQAAEYVVYNPMFVKILSIKPKSEYNIK